MKWARPTQSIVLGVLILCIFAPFVLLAESVSDEASLDPAFREAARLSLQGDFDGAITVLNKKINQDATLPSAFSNRGMAFYMKEEYARAIQDFNKATELDPEFAPGYQGKGMVLFKQHQVDAAIDQLTRAIVIDPAFGLAYHNRAIAYCHLDLFKSCLVDLIKARDSGYAVNPEFIKEIEGIVHEEDERIWKEIQGKPTPLKELPALPQKEN